MTNTTKHTPFEPVSTDRAVLLLVDQQEGLFSQIREPEHTRASLLALARSARLLGIPAVMTTALAGGPNGPQLPALACVADGYDAFVALDACGLFGPAPSVAAISRLTQAGVALADARVIVLEAMADNAHPKASGIYATLGAGLVPTGPAPARS